ncbi:5'-nucleotidase C-terminal domain-containing protein [Spongiimicrobium sp. 3-5]|uniref:5'-nucleotidase C-terminal domain-containing protein n=1 Tax=Spongiimicrobium sp. 3-5 TaxID=3332596 RepID=UPI00397EEAAD
MQQIVLFVTIIGFSSCQEQKSSLHQIHGRQLTITDSIKGLDSITAFVAPYHNRINQVLDSPLAYAPRMITKTVGKYNTTAGNLMADIVLEMANPIFKARTGKEIDFTVLNHGGIRSVISAGNVTARTAYEIMPFENLIAVVPLKGKSVRELVSFLIASDRAHPIAGMQILLNKDGALKSVNINGSPFNENRTYYVATSDFLVAGGDNMGFFSDNATVTDIDYLIRNAIIDYFKKMDTIAPVIDDRFTKLN